MNNKLIAKIGLGVVGTICTILSGAMDTNKDKKDTADTKGETKEE